MGTTSSTQSATHPIPARMTAAEFFAYPWPPNTQWELIDGRPIMVPSPTSDHQRSARGLVTGFDKLDPDEKLGLLFFAPMDVHLPTGDVVQPDVMLVAHGTPIPERKYIDGAPLLVVEIFLSQNKNRDKIGKFAAYQASGVAEYWLVDPDDVELEIYVPDAAGRYVRQAVTADGFAFSPTYNREFRLRAENEKLRYILDAREIGPAA